MSQSDISSNTPQGAEPELGAVARFFAGEGGLEEEAEIRRWAGESSENTKSLNDLAALWAMPEEHGQEWDTEALWLRLGVGEINVNADNSAVLAPVGRERLLGKTVRGWGRWTVGVGALTSCVLVFTLWQVFEFRSGNPASAPGVTTYTTRTGQRASVTLRNGTHVILGPATTLRVNNATFIDNGIFAEVAGEALFNVTHAVERAFTVTTHGVTTRVLGTEFVVRAYDASHIRVAVREGRVSIKSPVFTSGNAAIVSAGEAASVTANMMLSVVPITDMATDFAWANGELVLREVPLGEALVRLSRWYGMEFQVADSSLLKARVSANFLTSFSQFEIDVFARAIGARAVRSVNTITFSSAP